MSARSRQAWRLADVLGRQCGIEVRVEWSGRPRSGPWGGWIVAWSDGPTEPEMCTVAAGFLAGFPDLSTEIGYSRSLSAVHEATALLLWLERHPEHASRVGAVTLTVARDEVSYPERAAEPTRRRARALLRRCPGATLGYEVLRELAGHAGDGWPAVTAWLDELAAAHCPPVIDLAAERARRR